MKTDTIPRLFLLGLLTLALLPAHARGQAAEALSDHATAKGLADFRVSQAGPDGDAGFDALHPAVAFNPLAGEYLAVYAADDGVDGALEIFGQRLEAATGSLLGPAFRISTMGPDGDTGYDATTPAVAFNPASAQYLVVWAGTDADGAGIFGQRLDARGAEIGADDFRVAEQGRQPALVLNPATDEYLVVWEAAGDIFGQRLQAATGTALAPEAFRLSSMRAEDAAFTARRPAAAYNPDDNEYLVVWEGDQARSGDDAFEVFGQRLTASGDEIGTNDFRISDMGPDDDATFDAAQPALVYNPIAREYLVVWAGDDDTGGLADGEFEIFAQRIAPDGRERGANDFRVSDMGPLGDSRFDAAHPDVAFNPAAGEYLIVWRADDFQGKLVDGEQEIFGQRLGAADARALGERFRISDMGENDGDAAFDAIEAAVAFGGEAGYLALWFGDDTASGDNEHEIFGRRISAGDALATLDEVIEVPGEFLVSDAYPNPFSHATTINLAVKARQTVEVAVFDMLGRRVATLFQGPMEGGALRTFTFEAGSLPSGTYFVRAIGERFTESRQVLLVR